MTRIVVFVMPAGFDVQIVVVPREMYRPTIPSLKSLLETTPPEIPILLVRGGMPDRTVQAAQEIGGSRIRVVGPGRHLAPNAARAIGLDHVTSEYVIFIDNDVSCEQGWLHPLVDTAVQHDAWAVRPLVLQRIGDHITIHEAGGDCRLVSRKGALHLVESHRYSGKTLSGAPDLVTEQVEMFEFHTVLFHRDRLESLGGPDESMLATADHLDLAIRVQGAGGAIWIAPSSRVVYEVPSRVSAGDLSFFLGRWSPKWAIRSRDAFVEKYGVDVDSSTATWDYPNLHRRYAWRFIQRLGRMVLPRNLNPRILLKLDLRCSGVIDKVIGRFIANACLQLDPRWRGAGLRGDD